MEGLKRLRQRVRVGSIGRVLIWLAVGVLLATPPLRHWPSGINVQAESDTTVIVTWPSQEQKGGGFCESPPPDPYDSFELFFQPVGESSWASVGRTRDTFMTNDPQHRVGRYSVRGWRRDEVKWDTWTYVTTVPRHIGPFRLHEVSTGDTSAFGFEYYNGRFYVMDTTTTWAGPDVYVTDYKAGSPGPLLLMSPSLVSGDPGASVSSRSADYWRTTWFSSKLSGEQSLLPLWDPFAWTQVCSLPHAPLFLACRKDGGSYALIRALSFDGTSVELEAWYQSVYGLRFVGNIAFDTVVR